MKVYKKKNPITYLKSIFQNLMDNFKRNIKGIHITKLLLVMIKKIFEKEKSTSHRLNYGRFGHLSYDYRDSPKGLSIPTKTNKKGPKRIWVPKNMIVPIVDLINNRKETSTMEKGLCSMTFGPRLKDRLHLEVSKKDCPYQPGLTRKDPRESERHQSWYLDSGCSCHMIGERSIFQDLRSKVRGWVMFGGNQKGKIVRIGNIVNIPKFNGQLQKKFIDLRQSLAKFVNGSKNLKNIIHHKRHPYNKTSIGYDKKNI
ncbi:hypothetical protein CR513_25820, partial [Mucuna pruriens]